jgi:ZIP family zinc transporter
MTMLALRRTTRRLEENATDGSSIGMIVAIGLDLVIDGLVTGSGFALGERTGLLLIIALVLEYLFLGLAIASGLGEHASRRAIVLLPSGLAVLTIPAALLGFMVLGAQSPAVLGGFLAFGTVAMLYLVTEELLREAHEETDTEWATALFFVGFLIFLIISELG